MDSSTVASKAAYAFGRFRTGCRLLLRAIFTKLAYKRKGFAESQRQADRAFADREVLSTVAAAGSVLVGFVLWLAQLCSSKMATSCKSVHN